MVKIPRNLHAHINGGDPSERICVIGTEGRDGDYVQLSPRGSIMVFDDEHLAIWERAGDRQDGVRMTVYFRARDALAPSVPAGAVRFFGTTEVHRSGPIYEQVWECRTRRVTRC
jgi:hypothetical protein